MSFLTFHHDSDEFCKIPSLDGRCININFMRTVVFHFISFHPVRRLKACEYREPVTCKLLNAGKNSRPNGDYRSSATCSLGMHFILVFF